MTQNPENVKEPRVNVSITGEDAKSLEHLRALLEKRLLQRLSIAQVVKRLTKEALASELDLLKSDVDSTQLVIKL